MDKNFGKISGFPDNWVEAIGIINPQQPTEEEIKEAHKGMVDDAPVFWQFALDLKRNIDTLSADMKYLTTEQKQRVIQYQKLLHSIYADVEQLLGIMRDAYEKDADKEQSESPPESA